MTIRRRLRLLRRALAYSALAFVVLVALLLGAANQALPLAERHPDRIAAWLSERAGRPVAFDRVRTEWTRRGPLLRLDGLRIGEAGRQFAVGDTEMLVSIYGGLLPGRPFSEVRLRGLDLTLERDDAGHWRVRGLPGQQQPGGDPLAALEPLGELQIIDAALTVVAPGLGIRARVPAVDVRVQVHGDRVRAGLRARATVPPAGRGADGALRAVLDFDRRRGDGTLYAGARDAELAPWSALLRALGVAATGGRGRAEAWARLHRHRIASVTVDAALASVRLTSVEDSARSRAFDAVEAQLRWDATDGGWRLHAPRLRIRDAARAQSLDGLRLAGGARWGLQADALDAGPLLAVAALSDRLAPRLRAWIRTARPDAVLRDVRVGGTRDGALRARADVRRLAFAASGTSPGIEGLAGRLVGDESGVSLRLDPAARTRIDWPAGFGRTHEVALDGAVSGWRDGAGWRVATSSLRVRGAAFGLDVRGGLRSQGDGTRPRIDLAARILDVPIVAAKGFWVRHRMPPRVVAWLDAALAGGTVRNGRAVIAGDLDDWPFRGATGLFEATARLDDATIRFRPGWPAAEQLDAEVRFVSNGFAVRDGRARIAGVLVDTVSAGIDAYRDGTLSVDARTATDGAQLLELLRRSPLQATFGDTLRALTVAGPADADFALRLPLKPGSLTDIRGSVSLQRARLADARWALAFDDAAGRVDYSRTGLRVRDMRVRSEGRPGLLSLRAGDAVESRANGFEADLDATLAATTLLARAPELAWLGPYVSGSAPWRVGVAIARAPPGRPATARLRLASTLAGTAIALPAPLRKPAGAIWPTTIETPLPLAEGEVRVSVGDVLALRSRSANGRTGVRVALGGARLDEPAPAAGLLIGGRAATLDALDWIGVLQGGNQGGGLPLQRIDVAATRLNLIGGAFADTRIVVAPAGGGALSVRAEGPALAGGVAVPAARGAAIAGRFERLHWKPAPRDGSAASPETSPGAPAGGEFDPAVIPPLEIDVADLRVGAQPLGTAQLRTRPLARGLRIERLQTRTAAHRLDVNGDWTGRGAAMRTQLQARVGSDDFGALLAGLGAGGRLSGGRGSARFEATWPGSPAAFRVPALEGRLALDVREGRLLEVEPGAGRVLGLLSVAELPRRLTLDFRDLFAKGFAFNRIDGAVAFADGRARSDAIAIDGPSAAIAIDGTADLRAQSFDQTIEVRPKAGGLLTVAGAIAGGPVGAAIGAAANAVLQKPIGAMAARTYRVTGPWKAPKVEVIAREQSRATTSAPRPSG